MEQDYSEGARWYHLAAEQGDAKAQYHLGLMYFFGRGARRDYVTAQIWLSAASARSNESAKAIRELGARR